MQQSVPYITKKTNESSTSLTGEIIQQQSLWMLRSWMRATLVKERVVKNLRQGEVLELSLNSYKPGTEKGTPDLRTVAAHRTTLKVGAFKRHPVHTTPATPVVLFTSLNQGRRGSMSRQSNATQANAGRRRYKGGAINSFWLRKGNSQVARLIVSLAVIVDGCTQLTAWLPLFWQPSGEGLRHS